MIRIIGGREKGRRLKTLRGRKLRPTTERVREAIFDILGDDIMKSSVLDIFAGTGAMGIEALSRGAARVVFVESHRPMARIIRENLEGVERRRTASTVLVGDFRRAVRVLEGSPGSFDIAFMDPPYGKGLAQKSLKELAESSILSERAVVVVEHSRREGLEEEVNGLMLTERRRYGDTMVSFYMKVRQ